MLFAQSENHYGISAMPRLWSNQCQTKGSGTMKCLFYLRGTFCVFKLHMKLGIPRMCGEKSCNYHVEKDCRIPEAKEI
jgi:hypothetical protein